MPCFGWTLWTEDHDPPGTAYRKRLGPSARSQDHALPPWRRIESG